MAKLEGVKLIEVSRGEVSKIEYEGVEYELTEERARVGDIIFNIGGWGSQLKDAYYEVIKVDEYVRVEDEEGYLNGWVPYVQGERFKAFRKEKESNVGKYVVFSDVDGADLAAGKAYEIVDDFEVSGGSKKGFAVDDEVSERQHVYTFGHESRFTFEIYDEKPNEGTFDKPAQVDDMIRIVDAYGTAGVYGNGDVLTVKDVDDEGVVMEVEEWPDRHYIDDCEFEIIGRKESSEPKPEMEYATVKRRAKKGERILITQASGTFGDYDDGDVLTVTEEQCKVFGRDVGVGVDVEGAGYVGHDEYEVIVESADEEELRKRIKAGDKVRLKSGGGEIPLFGFKDGGEYEVSATRYEHGRYKYSDAVELIEGIIRGYALPSQLEVVKDELTAGTYVKVIGETYYRDISEGTIAKVTNGKDRDEEYRIELLDGSDFDYAPIESLEDELTAKELTFLEAGRKIDEYRRGDIAQVNDSPGASSDGSLVEITEVGSGGSISAEGVGRFTGEITAYEYRPVHLKPIAFVENRADKR